MEFFQYMYNLLTRPFRKKIGNFITWLQKMGKFLDELKESVYKVRRVWLIKTSYGQALELHGSARKVEKYPGEPDDYYKMRIIGALEAQFFGGSKSGLEALLASMGYPDSRIIPLYEEIKKYIDSDGILLDGSWQLDGARKLDIPNGIKIEYLGKWAEFIIELNIGKKRFLIEDYWLLINMIDRARNAHELVTEIILKMTTQFSSNVILDCEIEAIEFFRLDAGQYPKLNGIKQSKIDQLKLDGTWQMNGYYNLTSIKSVQGWMLGLNIPESELKVEEMFTLGTGRFNEDVWKLDGGGCRWKLDGSWLLDGGGIFLNGEKKLDGSWILGFSRSLGDSTIRLNGERVLGGRVLEGFHIGCVIKVYEKLVLTEEVRI